MSYNVFDCKPRAFDPLQVRKECPFFNRENQENRLESVYLDSAATAQKPQVVIDAVSQFLSKDNANVHRGVYRLAEEADQMYEEARCTVARFIQAADQNSIIFTHGATESLNMVAFGWAKNQLKHDDLVVLSEAEHHSNIVPWKMLADEIGIKISVVPITDSGAIDKEAYLRALEKKPKLVSLTALSNVTGAILPLAEYCALAHSAGALFSVDAAQYAAHFPLEVEKDNIDFLSFSSHKTYGPTGVGVLYVKPSVMVQMKPVYGGGGMVSRVSFTEVSFAPPPYCFEAGTPPISEAIGMAAALKWLGSFDQGARIEHENQLYQHMLSELSSIPGVRIAGYAPTNERAHQLQKSSVVSFVLKGIHPHDVSQLLSNRGIAVRAGHHCAMPLHQALLGTLGVPASVRASLGAYNQKAEIDCFVGAIAEIMETRNRSGF